MIDKDAIHIVTGHPRSGTSAAMISLKAGGMTIDYCKIREQNLKLLNTGHFIANSDFYEISFNEYDDKMKLPRPNFPDVKYRGKLINIFYWGLSNMRVDSYKIMFMLRNFEEIKESWDRVYQDANKMIIPSAHQYDNIMNKSISLLKNRNDVESLDIVNYSDLINDPYSVFRELDWGIDPVKSSEMIERNLHRVKKEELISV